MSDEDSELLGSESVEVNKVGTGSYELVIPEEIKTRLGLEPGDTVNVSVVVDSGQVYWDLDFPENDFTEEQIEELRDYFSSQSQ